MVCTWCLLGRLFAGKELTSDYQHKRIPSYSDPSVPKAYPSHIVSDYRKRNGFQGTVLPFYRRRSNS